MSKGYGGWGHLARLTNPKTCWHCKFFEEFGHCTKYPHKESMLDRETYLKVEDSRRKCVYEKKQQKYPDAYPNKYVPFQWLKQKNI